MAEWWAIPALVCGGIWAGDLFAIAWERSSAWRATPPAEFPETFTRTLRRMDPLQPLLLLACLGSTIAFTVGTNGAARPLAGAAAIGLAIVLAGSLAVQLPAQRRLAAARSGTPTVDVEGLRRRWIRVHLVRTLIGLTSFVMLAVAATVA
jgi:Domain of unknown function (DUF1772)